jgi:hypothetical protein
MPSGIRRAAARASPTLPSPCKPQCLIRGLLIRARATSHALTVRRNIDSLLGYIQGSPWPPAVGLAHQYFDGSGGDMGAKNEKEENSIFNTASVSTAIGGAILGSALGPVGALIGGSIGACISGLWSIKKNDSNNKIENMSSEIIENKEKEIKKLLSEIPIEKRDEIIENIRNNNEEGKK